MTLVLQNFVISYQEWVSTQSLRGLELQDGWLQRCVYIYNTVLVARTPRNQSVLSPVDCNIQIISYWHWLTSISKQRSVCIHRLAYGSTSSGHLLCSLAWHFNFIQSTVLHVWLFYTKVLENKPISKQCDVYSYGIVVWELLTHKIPFEDTLTDHELHKVVVMDKKVSIYS